MSQPETATTEDPKPAETAKAASADTFTLNLAGESVTLTVNAEGMVRVSRAFGGLIPAIDRVKAVDLDAMGVVVHVALGRPDGKSLQKTITAVAKSDVAEVTGACLDYVTRCLNGPGKG
jgi:hypothetical protein